MFAGLLEAADHQTNLVISHCQQRVLVPQDMGEGSQQDLGTLFLRGDDVAVVGEMNEELDSSINWSKVAGPVEIGSTRRR